MAIQIKTEQDYKQYVKGVLDRVYCHAEKVEITVLTLTGLLAMVADKNSIFVKEYAGEMKNQCHFSISGLPFSLRYLHDGQMVELSLGRGDKGYPLSVFNDAHSILIKDAISWLMPPDKLINSIPADLDYLFTPDELAILKNDKELMIARVAVVQRQMELNRVILDTVDFDLYERFTTGIALYILSRYHN